MIAPEALFPVPHSENTQPVSAEYNVRCRADVEHVIGAITAAMGRFPFGVSDGLALQWSLTETLEQMLFRENEPDAGNLHVQSQVTPAYVRVQIDHAPAPWEFSVSDIVSELQRPRPAAFVPFIPLRFARTYMTSVEIRDEGQRVILYRARGQGNATSSLPVGYDFQI